MKADEAVSTSKEGDERLSALIDELQRQYRSSGRVDIERVAHGDARLERELRELWSVARIALDVGEFQSTGGLDGDSTLPLAPSGRAGSKSDGDPPLELPRDFGDYELLEEIGRGGMGVVYRARQKTLGRLVALKLIIRGEFASAEESARFRAEAEAAARLDHPNIIKVLEVGIHRSWPFFTMPFIDGGSLADRLKSGPLEAREAAEILGAVTRAVDYAHREGVLHRDLKPANILFDRSGRPYVTDFGLAKRIESNGSLTRTGAIVGTPAYMSPEQAAGNRELTPAADIYSLGSILFHALTGQTPFPGASALEVVLQVLENEPPVPHSIVPTVDRDLEMVVLRCLQKPADLRYLSASKLAEDLEAYLEGEPLSVRAGSLRHMLARWFRETHHAVVLENWGVLWMLHSAVVLVLCAVTQWLHLRGAVSLWTYFSIWGVGFGAWAAVFWALRRRSGPVTLVERQVAHVWAGSFISCVGLFLTETLLSLEPLALSPALGLVAGSVFLSKASLLSGSFYLQAGALYLSTIPMAIYPDWAVGIFGVVSALCFFLPGWKYHAQRRSARAEKRHVSR